MMIKVSVGTASVLGLKRIANDAPPTTAYLLAGDRCNNSCSFCPQANNSKGRADMLSRVVWPQYDQQQVVRAIGEATAKNHIRRTCLQVVNNGEAKTKAVQFLQKLKQSIPVPVCVSASIGSIDEAKLLIEQGADKISIAIDCASPTLYPQVKGGMLEEKIAFIEQLNASLPGRIGTHLIVGLGETEEEMIRLMGKLIGQGITVALFAFTPVIGTKEEGRNPPEISSYRRIQAAHYLLSKKIKIIEDFSFNNSKILNYGLSKKEINSLLQDGVAFQTCGCEDCNRPYYNEKPGGVIYNYPRRLTENEVSAALEMLGLED